MSVRVRVRIPLRHRLLGPGLLLLGSLAAVPLLGDLRERTGALLLLWGAAHAAYLAGAWIVIRTHPDSWRGSLPFVLGVGLAARLLLIPSPPTLSDDLYRYLWDGRLVAHGVNPFLRAPSDPALARHDDDLLPRLNHPDVPTIYPPAAQLFFGAVALAHASPMAFKLALLPLEAALVLALLALLRRHELPRERVVLFAWNPLVVIEAYGSAHLDLITAVFLTLALAALAWKRPALAGAAYGIAVATKYTPLLLVPYLARRRAWMPLLTAAFTVGLLYVPFAAAGAAIFSGLKAYLTRWEFNGPAYLLLRTAVESEERVRLVLAAALAVCVIAVTLRARTAPGAALGVLTAFLLVSPTVYPWYLIPMIALLPLRPEPGLLALSGLVALSYLPLSRYHATGEWGLPEWIPWVEYGGAALAAGAAWIARRGAHAQERRAAWTSESTPT